MDDARENTGRKLGQLLAGIADHELPAAACERRVTGVFDDSRRVQPGGVFVALQGTQADGRRYLGDALQRGAAVLIGEDLQPTGDALVVSVPDARTALARLAVRWHGLDDAAASPLHLLGITGTNGKTTAAFMTQAILRAAGLRCGMLGTVHRDLYGRRVAAEMTTPGPLELTACLRDCRAAGAQVVVMEVSSHALAQRRTEGLQFRAAAFTNLTQDHLDYHGTMDAYCAAKRRLFTGLDEAAVAVVNRDDRYHEVLLGGCRARVVTYALDGDADVTAQIVREGLAGTVYRLRLGGAEFVLGSALAGRHNVYNALAAASLARALGTPTEAIERGLSAVRSVPGRLQRVACLPGVEVVVDYAHTPDALRNIVGVLKPLTRGRLIVVFGCGGDRDRLKRPLMAQAAAELGDMMVVTSDNPRSEDPQQIIADVLEGFDAAARRRVRVEPDRGRAIRAALAAAGEGDVVLIAGKGHESCQVVGGRRLPFDDVEVAMQVAAGLPAPQGGGIR